MEAEARAGVNGARAMVRRLLVRPAGRHGGRCEAGPARRVNTEMAGVALAAAGPRLVVLDPAELDESLVRT